jgi:hypothetical protein
MRWPVSSSSPVIQVRTTHRCRPDIGNELIPTVRPPPNNRCQKPLLQLLQLDSAIRPGLSEVDFRALFAKCGCGLIMTRKAFGSHYCATRTWIEPGEIIEITDSEDSNGA